MEVEKRPVYVGYNLKDIDRQNDDVRFVGASQMNTSRGDAISPASVVARRLAYRP